MLKNKAFSILLLFLSLQLISCSEDKYEIFQLDKRYWTAEDHKKATLELKYNWKPNGELPRLKNPENDLVIRKLVDKENFKVILDDENLGLDYRSDVSQDFFDNWKTLIDIYSAKNRKDEYVYEEEYLAIYDFGLALQLKYFKLGNDNILESTDNPEEPRIQKNVNSNVKTLINNFSYYLDHLNQEKRFSYQGKQTLSSTITQYFSALIDLYPEANYSQMNAKMKRLYEKCDSNEIKASLKSVIDKIES